MAGKFFVIIGASMKRYVIGDIHGCHDELVQLVTKIAEHAGITESYKIIFVGDYIDRGPKSRQVVALVRKLESIGHVALMGNHEDMFVNRIYDYSQATFTSYEGSFDMEDDISWMRNLPKYYEDDTIIVAHAAADPSLPMDEQNDTWLLWNRYDAGQKSFLDKHFYHGHTPIISGVEHYEDRTNVDSGCVFDGHLTAAIVGDNGETEGFISVKSSYGKKETEWED